MKKILLTVSFILIFNISNLFAFYHAGNFIDFLVHSNQVRIRTDALGVLAGPRNIRVVAGLTGANSYTDLIFDNRGNYDYTNAINRFIPSALVGVGYDSDLFGIAAGYEFTYKNSAYMVHTPILHATALNDSFRISIPVSIGIGGSDPKTSVNITGSTIVSTAIEARYYFPKEMPALSHIRLFVNYGSAYTPNVRDNSQYFHQQSFGLQARIHFKIETPEVLIEPIFRVQYDQALSTKKVGFNGFIPVYDNFDITAKGLNVYAPLVGAGLPSGLQGDPNLGSGMQGGYVDSIPAGFYSVEPYRVSVAVPVGFTATSADENIHFYLEPALSFTLISAKHIYQTTSENSPERTTPFMSLGYVVYGEIYIRPVKSLEWYIEVQAGGTSRVAETMKTENTDTRLVFNGSTGFHYYF
ncbi:cell surface protein [Brachyspira intermedia]|uniref:cell surface protein n=1 Tax=Brachyspira intermedia TaxID=84377 RepID=UPI0030062861